MTAGRWFWALFLAYALLGLSLALLTAGAPVPNSAPFAKSRSAV